METTTLVCPSLSCPDRSVETDGTVVRAEWESAWLGQTRHEPGMWKTPECACGTEGIDPESGQLDSAEEELGQRCPDCGVVSDKRLVAKHGFLCRYCKSEWAGDPA